MYYAKWSGVTVPVLNDINISLSSREITFSDLVLDFAGKTIDDLPYYLQEVELVDNEDNKLYTGYIDTYTLPQIKQQNQIEMELSITLLSPRKMTTKRVTSINKTDKLKNIIREIFSVLLPDGYFFKEINVPNKTITIRRLSRTVEELIEEICNKNSLYWNIDIDKGITVCSIEYMFSKSPIKQINITNYKDEIQGLMTINPQINGVDYANIINAKNVRVFNTFSYYSSTPIATVKSGDIYYFDNPIIVGIDTAKRILKDPDYTASFPHLELEYTNAGSSKNADIISQLNPIGSSDYIQYTNIGKKDDENKDWTLQYDSFFTNMVVGIKNNTQNTQQINLLYTMSELRYANMKLFNWQQIEEMKDNVTPSGQIEKIIDLNEQWFTTEELIDFIDNQFVNNDKNTDEIKIIYDENNDIEVGDRIVFYLPQYLVIGNFVVTDINKTKSGNNPFIYEITLRNTGLLDNYIDFFRSPEQEEQEDKTQVEYIVEYAGGDTIIQENEVVEVES